MNNITSSAHIAASTGSNNTHKKKSVRNPYRLAHTVGGCHCGPTTSIDDIRNGGDPIQNKINRIKRGLR